MAQGGARPGTPSPQAEKWPQRLGGHPDSLPVPRLLCLTLISNLPSDVAERLIRAAGANSNGLGGVPGSLSGPEIKAEGRDFRKPVRAPL